MKKIKIIILIIISLFFLMVLIGGIRVFILQKYYGYNEIHIFEKSKKLSIFNDSIVNNLKIESSARDGLDDTIYFLSYANEYQFVYWKLNQYHRNSLSDFKEASFKHLDKQNFKDYVVIGYPKEPFIDIRQKLNLPKSTYISYCFDGSADEIKKIKGIDYILYNLNCTTIEFFTDGKHYDISIDRLSDSYANLMIFKYDNTISVLLMASLKGEDLKKEDLLKLLNNKDFPIE